MDAKGAATAEVLTYTVLTLKEGAPWEPNTVSRLTGRFGCPAFGRKGYSHILVIGGEHSLEKIEEALGAEDETLKFTWEIVFGKQNLPIPFPE